MSIVALPLLAGALLTLPQVDRGFAASGGALGWQNGAAAFDLFIDPDGKVAQCTALYADEPERTPRVCRSLIGRSISAGARDAAGQPVHALFSVGVMTGELANSFDQRHLPGPADLIVDVQSLPEGRSQRGVLVAALIGADGRVDTCEPMYGADRLSTLACQQAQGQTFRIYRDAGGKAVPYVTDLKVLFRVG